MNELEQFKKNYKQRIAAVAESKTNWLKDFIETNYKGSYNQEPYHEIGKRLPVKIVVKQNEINQCRTVKRQKIDHVLFDDKLYGYWQEGLTILEIARKIKKSKKYVQAKLNKIFKERGFDLSLRTNNTKNIKS